MKLIALSIVTVLALSSCALDKKLSGMDAKMDKVASSAQDMDTQLKQMASQISQMTTYTQQLVDIMKKLVGSLTGPGPDPGTGAPAPSASPASGMTTDLSTQSGPELTATRDLVKQAVETKNSLSKENVQLASFDPGIVIAPPSTNIPPANQALIVEISSLMTQLRK